MPEGFEVRPGEVAGAGRTACDLAEALRTARTTWNGATKDGGACGLSVARNAYTGMHDTWFDEIGVHITLLEQLCKELRASANTYGGIDTAVGDAFGRRGGHVQ
ncbi:hypothetical protein EV193_101724 [Herbihabitans rhizosphaerae]|uniref:Excreted virulence factor EspC (Type VII ESX diderm) n=1 Tax=Herbihabitans rhizosphaerae TaxID=1872711 RepID=A0A4Q7L6B5_9PSEU|nr:hypothetical protein [Herbihabitans rhizosphaerae]RZS44844.1 hypothetical protein EV193_101724 [Herbihabitans rhizosphaerae]